MEKILYVCKYRKSRINILKVIVCKLYKSCKAIKKINKFKVERSGCLYIKIERKENQHCKLMYREWNYSIASSCLYIKTERKVTNTANLCIENGTTVLPVVVCI